MPTLSRLSGLETSKNVIKQPDWIIPKRKGMKSQLKVYNSLTRKKEEFVESQSGVVSWYSCGPTVYSHSHMGHARNYVSFDINRRIMEKYFGYRVKYVQNITDIDDKIIIASRREHLFQKYVTNIYKIITPELVETCKEQFKEYINFFFEDYRGNDIEKDFWGWATSMNADLDQKLDPKYKMHLRICLDTYEILYKSKRENLSLEIFFKGVKEISMFSLDRKYGSTVNDASISRDFAMKWENLFNQDMKKLNVLPPTIVTRVSEYIPEIIIFIDKIIENGFAYTGIDGSVYFDTLKFDSAPNHVYSKLQPWNKKNLSLMEEGELHVLEDTRIKKNPADFALWKVSKPGEPFWESKWSNGRPGWHIECSVMASAIFQDVLDIHSGGIDLSFPHHDNELAQSEAYFNHNQWVNYFLHSGHLHISGQKMSKSLKNFITIEDALKQYSSRLLRLIFCIVPWDKPMDFNDNLIQKAKFFESTFSNFFTMFRAIKSKYDLDNKEKDTSMKVTSQEINLFNCLEKLQMEVHNFFCDNFSVSMALKSLIELVSLSNNYINSCKSNPLALNINSLSTIVRWIVEILEILGFETSSDKLGWCSSHESDSISSEKGLNKHLVLLSSFRDSVRSHAIKKKDHSEFLTLTDDLRISLLHHSISLDDNFEGPALIKQISLQEKEDLILQSKISQERSQKKKQNAKLKNEVISSAKIRINPQDLYKDAALYSEWDEQGIPTKHKSGEEVSKSMRKKLLKFYMLQKKHYDSFLASNNSNEK